MANRIIKLIPDGGTASFEQAFGNYSNAGGRGKRKLKAILSGGVSEIATRAREAKEAKQRANKAKADAMIAKAKKEAKWRKRKAAEEAAAKAEAAQNIQYDRFGNPIPVSGGIAGFDPQKAIAAGYQIDSYTGWPIDPNTGYPFDPNMPNPPDPYVTQQQYQTDQYGTPVMPVGGYPQYPQYNQYQMPQQPMYGPRGGSPYESTEDWNANPSDFKGWGNAEDVETEDASQDDQGEDEEASYQEDGEFDPSLDNEYIQGVDGAIQSKIDPRIMNIVSKSEWKKAKLKSLADKINRGQKMYEEADDYSDPHNRRVMISAKLAPIKEEHKKLTDEISSLEGQIDTYSSASGPNAKQVKMAKDIAARDIEKQRILARTQKMKGIETGHEMPVDSEMNPANKKIKIQKTSNATGIIATDAKDDADAVPPRVVDLQFSNAEGSNTKKIAIGVTVGVVLAGGLIWALKHYKVI